VSNLSPDKFARFVERAQDIVNRHGKRMIGWEEIFRAKLLPTTLTQLWRTDSARAALAQGSKLILSPAPKVYLDMKYTAGTELGLDWAALVDVRTAYDWDPANYLPGITDADIVGVEAPLWSETIRNITAAEYLAMPRLPAIAEVAWTPRTAQRWEDFRTRIAAHAPRWRLLGINYYASPQIPWN
jgi:hexosaminidase